VDFDYLCKVSWHNATAFGLFQLTVIAAKMEQKCDYQPSASIPIQPG
jgi:hypothetical protein